MQMRCEHRARSRLGHPAGTARNGRTGPVGLPARWPTKPTVHDVESLLLWTWPLTGGARALALKPMVEPARCVIFWPSYVLFVFVIDRVDCLSVLKYSYLKASMNRFKYYRNFKRKTTRAKHDTAVVILPYIQNEYQYIYYVYRALSS